ncbi:MAG: putative phage tail protein [Hyphomicrobium sp.]|nr:putative phage tail protein [Hyphomicrobium sp.]
MSCFWLEPRGTAADTLTRHFPLGVAWAMFRTPGKMARRLLEAYAAAYDDLSSALCRLVAELDPRTTTELIGEWETGLSLPDQCLPDATTLEERRQQILFRLEKRRWTTAADWKELALLFGLVIEITPGWIVQKPALYAFDYPKRYDLFPKLGRFRVYIDLLNADFGGYDYGAADRGDGYPIPYLPSTERYERFKCLIDRIRPANSIVIWDAPALALPAEPPVMTWGADNNLVWYPSALTWGT